ncbi:MAG TPA: glycosyltransferase family A protein [Solirubrobacteraceae bacterium]
MTSESIARTSVVIAAYDTDRFGDLADAVRALGQQSVPPREVIVAVDRNPELVALASRQLPTVTVVPNREHHGAGGARNSGAAVASGELIAFMDDDAVPSPDWIERIEDCLGEDGVIGVGGFIEPWWLGRQPQWFPAEFGWVVGCSYTGLPNGRARVRNVIAANMAIRRQVFESIGGFRRDFGKQGGHSEPEETDLCIRAARRWPERTWIYDPAIHVRHRVPSSRARFGYFVRRCFNEGTGKASLASLVGPGDALSEETAYVRKVLPRGIAQGLAAFFGGRDAFGLLRAAAIVVGLSVTAAAYLATSALARMPTRSRRRTAA